MPRGARECHRKIRAQCRHGRSSKRRAEGALRRNELGPERPLSGDSPKPADALNDEAAMRYNGWDLDGATLAKHRSATAPRRSLGTPAVLQTLGSGLPKLPELGRVRGPRLGRPWTTLGQVAPAWAKVGPSSVQFRPSSTSIGQMWPASARFSRFGPNWGRKWPNSGQC